MSREAEDRQGKQDRQEADKPVTRAADKRGVEEAAAPPAGQAEATRGEPRAQEWTPVTTPQRTT